MKCAANEVSQCAHTWLVTTKVPNLTTSFVIGMPSAPDCCTVVVAVAALCSLRDSKSAAKTICWRCLRGGSGAQQFRNRLAFEPSTQRRYGSAKTVVRGRHWAAQAWASALGVGGRRNRVTCPQRVAGFEPFIRLILFVYKGALHDALSTDDRGDEQGPGRPAVGLPARPGRTIRHNAAVSH